MLQEKDRMSEKKGHPSFSKSLFSGYIYDDLLFPFPHLKKEDNENLDLILDTLNKFMDGYVDSRQFDRDEEMPQDVINGWKELGFFGLLIPEKYGGYGLNNTQYVRILEQVGSVDGSTALLLGAHQSIGMKGLLLFGTEEQKQLYLPRLATGEMLAAYCLTEPGAGSDAAGISTRAVRDEKRKVYILNGSKMWITNGGIADFFTVFARDEMTMPDGSKRDRITAFLVTREMGVKSGKEEKKLGIRGSSTTALFFENVEIPFENVLGERGKGFKIAMEILNSGRVGLAGGCVGGSKSALRQILAYVKEREQFGKPLNNFELIKEKLAGIAMNIFVAESMIYLTTGMIDRGDIDFSLESAICKIRATDNLWHDVSECLQMAGGIGYSQEYPYEQNLRDARINIIFEGTNEILHIFVALAGMQEHGEYLKKMGKALKDPIKGFGLITDYAVQYMKGRLTTDRLPEVDSQLAAAKTEFERWAKNLHITAERVLIKYGKNIIEQEIIQKRLADAIIDLYGMIACISRVDTNIKNFGHDACLHEVRICNAFCEQAWRRIRRNILMVDKNDDDQILAIADYVIDQEKYPYNDVFKNQ
jgi:acyl-CoA dehydrogenase family protein 9